MLNEENWEQEKQHLKSVFSKIENQIANMQGEIKELSNFLSEQVVTSSEDYYAMDDEEKAETKTVFDNMEFAIIKMNERLEKIKKLEKSCYFGSFIFSGESGFNNVYLGITGFIDDKNFPLICDWRAPICSLFYDYEIGDASYSSNGETFSGSLLQKRQYKVKRDELVYALDSSLAISDEILKEELARDRTNKMGNIVATIQKEQNAIIRNSAFENMIIQGCAGSGKTSIALHRSAYLLYSMRKELNSNNILVISPNKQFSAYIENVLPELAENSVSSKVFLDYAKEILKCKVEDENENFKRLLSLNKLQLKDYNYKNSFEFLSDLKEFLFANENVFCPKDFVLGNDKIEKEILSKLYYETYKNQKPCERLENITYYICEELNLPEVVYDRVRNNVYKMLNFNLFNFYNKFLSENKNIINKEEVVFEKLRNEDLAPLMLIKNHFYKLKVDLEIKLVVLDEFENYSACEFEFFKQLFDAKFIIVGDINQSIFKELNFEFISNLSKMFSAQTISLGKCYRSTKQIAIFNNKLKNLDFEFVERDGEEVETILKENLTSKLSSLKEKFSTIAVIFNSSSDAQQFALQNNSLNISLNSFENGKILVSNVSNVQGLEFDCVVVVDYLNYKNEIEKNMLYNITTRATSKLILCIDNI